MGRITGRSAGRERYREWSFEGVGKVRQRHQFAADDHHHNPGLYR
jgi:hypothetical protein